MDYWWLLVVILLFVPIGEASIFDVVIHFVDKPKQVRPSQVGKKVKVISGWHYACLRGHEV